ncbi:MAG: hypothetical protein IE909_10635, partial [Campylobacterales bacterium]|nr:hypothetical protein [Campylobacterales bacterium]
SYLNGLFRIIEGVLQFEYASDDNVTNLQNITYTLPTNFINSWHYVSATLQSDGTNTIAKLYIDGEEVANATWNLIAALGSTTTEDFGIGANVNTSGSNSAEWFEGKIAEVSIWGKVLTQTEIQHLMASSPNTNDSSLVGYWPLNEGTSTTAKDYSVNSNNGTIAGATWTNTAPTIYGDTLYTDYGITSWQKLIVENNTTFPTFSLNGHDFANELSATGLFKYSSSGENDFIYTTTTNPDLNLTILVKTARSIIYDQNGTNGDDIISLMSASIETLDGGDGNDTLVLTQDQSNYFITKLDSEYIVDNGTDIIKLINIENLNFADTSGIEIINTINNNAPTISDTNITVAENNNFLSIDLNISDNDNDTLNYTISGIDANYFDINSSSGVITFITTPDYEMKNSYDFNVSVSDGYITTTKKIQVIIIDDLSDNFIPLSLNLLNINTLDHNISSIWIIGTDDNNESLDIAPNYIYTDGDHNLSAPIFNPDHNFSIVVNVDNNQTQYFYNFTDMMLYETNETNDSFKHIIDANNSTFTIDFSSNNWVEAQMIQPLHKLTITSSIDYNIVSITMIDQTTGINNFILPNAMIDINGTYEYNLTDLIAFDTNYTVQITLDDNSSWYYSNGMLTNQIDTYGNGFINFAPEVYDYILHVENIYEYSQENIITSKEDLIYQMSYNESYYGTTFDPWAKIDPVLYGEINGSLNILQPLYGAWFEQYQTYDGNITEFGIEQLNIDQDNQLWSRIEKNYATDANETIEESGSLSVDLNNIFIINKDTQDFMELKFSEVFDYTVLNNMVTMNFPDLNFTNGDEAQIIFAKNLVDEIESWDVVKDWETNTTFTNFSDFISGFDGSMFECMYHDINCSSGGLVFNSNGTLSLQQNNQTTVLYAGSWDIDDLNGSIIHIKPEVSGFESNRIFILEDGIVKYGEIIKAGTVEAFMNYNQSAMDKIIAYFGPLYNTINGTSIEFGFDPLNTSPIFNTANYHFTIEENNTTATFIVDANDSEQTDLNYTLSGIDSSFFDINSSTGEIKFITTPDYETLEDSDSNNIYEFNVTVSDGEFNITTTVDITVQNIDELHIFENNLTDINITEDMNDSIVIPIAIVDPEMENNITLSANSSDYTIAEVYIDYTTNQLHILPYDNQEGTITITLEATI